MVDVTLQKAKSQFKFERKIISTGGSFAITMPPDLSSFYKLKKGGKIQIIPQSAKEMKVIPHPINKNKQQLFIGLQNTVLECSFEAKRDTVFIVMYLMGNKTEVLGNYTESQLKAFFEGVGFNKESVI